MKTDFVLEQDYHRVVGNSIGVSKNKHNEIIGKKIKILQRAMIICKNNVLEIFSMNELLRDTGSAWHIT